MGVPKARKSKFNRAGGKNLRNRRKTLVLAACAAVGSGEVVAADAGSMQQTLHREVLHSKRRQKYRCKFLQSLKVHFWSVIPRQVKLEGFRLVKTDMLQNMLSVTARHVAECEAVQEKLKCKIIETPILLMNETRTQGLASEIRGQCQGCDQAYVFRTSPLINTSESGKRFEVNVRAVWGTMVSGGGRAQLNETMCTLGLSGLSQPTFSAIEHEIGSLWGSVIEEDMLAAGREERQLAIDRGDFHNGVPAISVICDGGWSKRSHKHTYNALGGVAIIIGAATKKILHVGVRNKTCYICTIADTKQVAPAAHECFKNWSASSQAMEADVIVEGFQAAESKHGIRYMRLIADGDSSVYARIQEQVPEWGAHVAKIECANHSCKCLRSNLEKLVQDNPSYKGKDKLTLVTRIRLTTAVRCAIRMRSAETNRTEATKKLAHDIRNSVHHVFGVHTTCSPDFCKTKSTQQQPTTEAVLDETSSVEALCSDQHSFWEQGTSEAAMEESRQGTHQAPDPTNSELIRAVSILLNRLAEKANRLIGNHTTNLAECWMAIRTKFDGGKMYNRCHRGSWQARCYGGALRQNLGPHWSPTVWSKVTNTEPTEAFERLYTSRAKQLGHCKKSKARPDVKARARKRRSALNSSARSKKAKAEYGKEAVDVVPDLSPEALKVACDLFREKEVSCSSGKIAEVEKLTRQQSSCALWKAERRSRLTASVFRDVVVRKTSTPVTPLVQRLLYATFTGNRYTRLGLANESVATQEYIMYKAEKGVNVQVYSVGLIIHPVMQHLAASPDGKVCEAGGPTGLLELKTVLQTNRLSFQDAAKKPTFCLKLIGAKLQLRTNHQFFYQCQGQMNIANLPWVDLVVRRTQPYQLHVERIVRDTNFWSNIMVPKLSAFYTKALLPELASPRHDKSPGIREPGVWVS
jgi:hypothetical protein